MAGRFAVSVQDLNNHKNANGAHDATNITANLTTVDGYNHDTVSTALEGLNTVINNNLSPFATGITPGKVQLTTDLGGTYDNPYVVGLLGRTLIENSLLTNHTWVYNGTSWINGLTPVTGDIGYVSNVMRVNSIGGQLGAGNVNIGKNLLYIGDFALNINNNNHNQATTPNSLTMQIIGKSIVHASNTSIGGDIIINPGVNTTNGFRGSIRLNNNSVQLLSGSNANTKINVLGGTAASTSASAGFNSLGDCVNLIGTTATEPSGSTSAGSVLYATDGLLKYRNYLSTKNYWVGNPENPEIWRDVADNNSGSVYKERFTALQAINTVTDIRTYSINNTAIFSNTFPRMISVRVLATAIANSTGVDARSTELVATFKVLTGPTLSQVGTTVVLFDSGANITNPTITLTGTNIRVTSAAHASQQCRTHYKIEIMQY